MKKKIIFIITGIILALILGGIIFYNVSLSKVSKESEKVSFVIESGTSTRKVVENLKEANLIKNEFVSLIYIKLHGDIVIKAGTYELNRNMDARSIFEKLGLGNDKENTVRITFKEGVVLKEYINLIAESTDNSYEELVEEINSKEFLEPLIKDYWFLTDDILDEDIYYPLEGYLFPNTYEFYKDASLNTIVRKMLNETERRLNSVKSELDNSGYSVHDILTMASIIEKEAIKEDDRAKVSQVIYKRLDINMSLGMDVTSYYGVQKDMKEPILQVDLNDENPYNTRVLSKKGLPIGPICNPSISSIKAALNPSDTDFVFFFADVKTGKVYFTASEKEFEAFKDMYS